MELTAEHDRGGGVSFAYSPFSEMDASHVECICETFILPLSIEDIYVMS